MSKALIAFSALLGLFSYNSFAASDDGSSCKQKAELAEEANVRFIGASTCADVGSVFTGNDHCQVRKTPSSGCQIDNFGVPVGLGYYFTGCLAGTNCSESPQPLPPVDVPVPPVLPPVAVVPVTPEDLHNPTGNVYFTNIQTELVNQRILSQDVLDNVYKLFTATNSLSATTHSNIINAKHEILNSVGSRTFQLSNNVAALSSQLSYTQNNLLNTINNQADQAAQNEVFTTNKILDAIADKDDLINRLDGIDAEVAAVGNTLNYVALAEESSLLRDQEILQGVNQTRAIASNVNEITFGTRDSLSQLSGSVQALQNTVNAIADEIVPPPCGGFFQPPCSSDNGSGGGTDLTEITSLLTQMSSDVQSIRNQIVPSNCGGIDQPPCSGSGSSVDFDPVIAAINESNELLTDIEDEIKDVEEATEDVEDTVDDGFDNLRDRLFGDGNISYYDGCTPGENCPGDPNDWGPGITEEGAFRVANRNLQTISTKTNQVVDSVNALGDKLDTINATIAAGGSGSSSDLTDTNQKLDTISETLEGVSSGLSAVGLSESDFNVEDGIFDALGITGEETVADLTSDPVRLQDFSGQFGSLPSAVCPDNVPITFRLFNSSYSFNLFYKPVCDFMAIAGTVLNFAIWFSVPFIVFGNKRTA